MKPTLTLANAGLIIAGIILIGCGLYRTVPLKFNKMFWTMNVPVTIMLIVGMFILYRWPIKEGTANWATATVRTAGMFVPLMALICLVMGIGTVIAGFHAESIQKHLVKHPFMDLVLGCFLTPTSSTMTPVVTEAWKTPELRPIIAYFLLMSKNVSVPLFMMLIFGFKAGSPIPSRMYVMSVLVFILLFLFIRPLYVVTDWICLHMHFGWDTTVTVAKENWRSLRQKVLA